MSSTINSRIKHKRGTTINWNNATGFIPLEGELIVYTDYKTIQEEIDGQVETIDVPGIKIGDGRTYVQDLPFVDEELRIELLEHIGDSTIHTSTQEKNFWNNKINVNDAAEVINGTLILNRN